MNGVNELLKIYLKKKTNLSDERLDQWISLFIPKKINKNDYLLREGEVAKYTAFVASGCLRLYSVDPKGKEHILQFAPEEWWIGDMESFSKSIPSSYFIDAIEESEILLMDLQAQEKLFQQIPESVVFFQQLMQNRQVATQKRIIFSMSASAEQRYLDFIKTYPSFTQRVPQHMIASYLGITPESLSRIRKQVVTKK
jgi:CRP-like cAMP-binding protein